MKFIIPIMTSAITIISGGCALTSDEAVPVVFATHMSPITSVRDKDDPLQVIRFARTLSDEGRNLEAARIYEDAANRFESVDKKFEIDCQKEAVREYWIAGKYAKARKLLDELESDQDIYRRASGEKSLARLRKMLSSGS